MENDLEIWEMAKTFGKWLRYMVHGLSIWETAWLSWKCLIWQMAKICGKWRIYFGIGLSVWGKIFGNDVDLWEMSQICGEMT